MACGDRNDLNQLWSYICEVSGCDLEAIYGQRRVGDIPHSLADISKAKDRLEYKPTVKLKDGISKAFEWYHKNMKNGQ